MTNEFNLSKKRIDRGDWVHYSEESVKEFIRLCEDNSEEINGTSYIKVSKMQKFAGDKLI